MPNSPVEREKYVELALGEIEKFAILLARQSYFWNGETFVLGVLSLDFSSRGTYSSRSTLIATAPSRAIWLVPKPQWLLHE